MTLKELTDHNVIQNVSALIKEIQSLTDDWHDTFYSDDDREVYEHWLVSEWLAEKLKSHGEIVVMNFYGLKVWGRCTTGQAVKMDDVIQNIFNSLRT